MTITRHSLDELERAAREVEDARAAVDRAHDAVIAAGSELRGLRGIAGELTAQRALEDRRERLREAERAERDALWRHFIRAEWVRKLLDPREAA